MLKQQGVGYSTVHKQDAALGTQVGSVDEILRLL